MSHRILMFGQHMARTQRNWEIGTHHMGSMHFVGLYSGACSVSSVKRGQYELMRMCSSKGCKGEG